MLVGPDWRAGATSDEMLAEIIRGKGVRYDSLAANACVRLFREKGYASPAAA